MSNKKLSRSFYARDVVVVAKNLLGKYLVHRVNNLERIGKIVETEAYLGAHDLASHSSHGLTKRNAVVFGPIGHAYVYFIYGMYYCLNVVAEQTGKGAAILIRAVEPIENCVGKTSGPGLLCNALEISRKQNECNLLGDELYITAPDNEEKISIVARPRIGVDYAKNWARRLLRFYIKGNPWVSKK